MQQTITLLTVGETARLLRISRGLLYRLARQRMLPGVRLGRSLRFEKGALEKFIADGGQQNDPDAAGARR
jgi:excisionase family DNA binding protein